MATATAIAATASTISLGPSTTGVLNVPQSSISPESYSVASKLLQRNHDDFHMYFNQSGFHNHIAHHLLTILALGATPSQLQDAYDNNTGYQRPQFPIDPKTVNAMSRDAFAKYLGKERYFHDYEEYFRREIESRNGDWQSMLSDRLFGASAEAQDLLIRTFAGFYHPIIHLGFGIEFAQPAIIVEALAQAATHDNWPKEFLTTTDRLAEARIAQKEKSRSLFSILQESRENTRIRNSVDENDANKVRDGVFARAMPDIAALCSQWHVDIDSDSTSSEYKARVDEELRLKTAEMINACAYFAGAAQHASHRKQVKFDFFYMHCVNASVFFSAFLRDDVKSWLDPRAHARLLMWKAWSDVAMYVSRGCPELFVDEIRTYTPRHGSDGWAEIFARVDAMGTDDGHASKLIRAFANGERACREFEGREESRDWMIRGEDWLKLGHMVIDSVEGPGQKWVRNAGFDSAWEGVKERSGSVGRTNGNKKETGEAHEKL